MLIRQDADDPSLLKQCGGSLHLLLAIKGMHATATAVAVHKIIHQRATKRLIDASSLAGFHEFGDLSIDLPVSKMTQCGDGAPTLGFFSDDPILPVRFLVEAESGAKLLLAQGRDLDRADDICPEIKKMLQGDPGCLLVRKRRAEGNPEILFGETAVAGQNQPHQKSDSLSQNETERDGEQSDQGDNR